MRIITSTIDDQDFAGRMDRFMVRFRLSLFLNSSGIRKLRGISPLVLFRSIFELAFIGRNIYTRPRPSCTDIGKDAVYRFMSVPRYNWRRLIGLLSGYVVRSFLSPLTQPDRQSVLILDDTPYDRSRSKRVELLSRIRDHTSKGYFKGFRMLTLGWSDGTSFVPLDHAILSSPNKKNRIQGITKNLDSRTCGSRRRREALCKSTELIVPMIRRALGLFIPAKYLVMDSWFGFPAVVRSIMSDIHVICMVKNTPKIFYESEESRLTLSQCYRKIRKRRGMAQIKGSLVVGIGDGKQARLVFVNRRNRENRTTWLALLCTDLSLPKKEIVRIYGKRWDIEVFFKMAKHYLKLDSELQVRDFDSILAHSTICYDPFHLPCSGTTPRFR